MTRVFVLDACALVAALKNESGADVVADAFRLAESGAARIVMNRINLLEVYYGFYKDKGKDYADELLGQIMQSAMTVDDFDERLFSEAGRLKASYRISLADSIALAETLAVDGELLTADHHEFDVIEERERMRFHWIR